MAKRVTLNSGHRPISSKGRGCRMCKSRPLRRGHLDVARQRRKK